MTHLQHMPGDPRLVDQLVYDLKSKGLFDQFRKECISDVDTRPAYQNLRQRVEGSVSNFLSRQSWHSELNKNQLREKLRKHLLDGNYLDQGLERIVDQVVNPKVASVFIPKVEDVVCNFLGIPRKKALETVTAQTSNGKQEDCSNLLPTDLEAVSPGSVKSNDDKNESMDISEVTEDSKIDVEVEKLEENVKVDVKTDVGDKDKINDEQETRLSGISVLTLHDSDTSIDKSLIPLPAEEIKLEDIPAPENSPPNIKNKKIDLEKIELPKEPNLSTDIPLPDEMPKDDKDNYFKPISIQSEDDSSSDSSIIRNMSPLTPIRNFNNENSCDAQQAFENESDSKTDDIKEPSSFRFTIEAKSDNSSDAVKSEKKEPSPEENLSYQFDSQVNVNTVNTPLYDESSNSNNLHIDYESDVNSKANVVAKPEADQASRDSKKDRSSDERKSSHKSSHRNRDSHRHSSSKDKDKQPDLKHLSSRDATKHDKKSSKDDKAKSSKEKSSDKSDKKNSRGSSKHRSSHKSSSHKDSKHRSSSSKNSRKSDDKKPSSSSSSSHRDRSQKSDDKSSKDKSRESSSRSGSHRSSKDRRSSKSKHEEKENKEKKDKKEADDHYGLSGRGNPNRRSTDRDSNDGSSSSKGSQLQSSAKSSTSKKETKGSSKSDNVSTTDSTSPSDKENTVNEVKEAKNVSQAKPIVRVDTHLEIPLSSPPRLPFIPDVTLKKPRFAANMEEAKRMIKMRKFLEDEQKRMNQEATLLLEFQANVRPSLSQVYSSIPGPELEFACVSNTEDADEKPGKLGIDDEIKPVMPEDKVTEVKAATNEDAKDLIAETLIAIHHGENDDIAEEADIKPSESVEESNKSLLESLNGSKSPETVAVDKINKDNIVVETTECRFNENGNNKKRTEYFEVTIITEEVSEAEEYRDTEGPQMRINEDVSQQSCDEDLFKYFAEHEKYSAELEKDRFSKFFKVYEKSCCDKMYLINCDPYEENLIREASESFGAFEIVTYQKNGHLKLPKTSRNIVKNVNVTTEIALPTKVTENYENHLNSPSNSPVFSPVKSEGSFELSSDYSAKLQEMVNRTSRQEIMEIILGSAINEPEIDYCTDSQIDKADYNMFTITSDLEQVMDDEAEINLKRKLVDSPGNNNRNVLTPKRMRTLSVSDEISSTTEETEDTPNNNKVPHNPRSKYLGKARRVGLCRPKRPSNTHPNSPSSDKSVENYSQNTTAAAAPRGKVKRAVQRYTVADLYKPKLHYLSRRNNLS